MMPSWQWLFLPFSPDSGLSPAAANLAMMQWIRAAYQLQHSELSTGEGGVPQRAGHSATALPDGRVLVFGGVDAGGRHCNDCFLLDPARMRWLKLGAPITRGSPPKPRAYHTCGRTPDFCVACD